MIRDLANAVKTDLRARFYPHPVTYGPERMAHDGFRDAIVFARDRGAGDAIVPVIGATRPRATSTGAEAPYLRNVAGSFTVYARSSRPGADVADHEGIGCEEHAALAEVGAALRLNGDALLRRFPEV